MKLGNYLTVRSYYD